MRSHTCIRPLIKSLTASGRCRRQISEHAPSSNLLSRSKSSITIIMLFSGLHLTVLNSPLAPEYPSTLAVFVRSINAYISGSDTVRVIDTEDFPSIVGRVLTVTNSLEDIPEGEAVHPFILNHRTLPSTSKPIKLQWHVVNNDRFWGRSDKLCRACGNIDEAAPTNCILWISSCQISESVHFIHHQDCEHQIYGPVHNRANTYLIRFTATYDNNESIEIKEILHENFSSFPTTSKIGSPSTCTERRLEFLLSECQTSQELLIKSGKLATSVSKTTTMSREKACWLQSRLASVEIKQSTKKTKQCVSHSNLSIETAVLPTRHVTIRVRTSNDFRITRQIFHSGYGTGVRKKFTPIKDKDIRALNPSCLRRGDTINVTDAPLENYSEEDTTGWFDPNASDTTNYTNPNRNFIPWVFNHRSRTCRVSMKCCAVVVGACNAHFLDDMLDSIENEWGERPIPRQPIVVHLLYIGQAVEVDGFPWQIRDIDLDGNLVTLYDEDSEDVIYRSLEIVASNTM